MMEDSEMTKELQEKTEVGSISDGMVDAFMMDFEDEEEEPRMMDLHPQT